MQRSRAQFLIVAAVVLAGLAAPRASAADDFGRIVHHIEAQYHVHRQHRFVMGLAGFAVKFYHFAGVKNLKGAIFENQPFLEAGPDTRFDQVVQQALNSGWQPLVQSWDRHTGERTYVYAKEVSSKKGSDMKLLVVNLESNEAVVLQVKVDPHKLNAFLEQTMPGDHRRPVRREEAGPETQQKAEVAAATPPDWYGTCLFPQDDAQALTQP